MSATRPHRARRAQHGTSLIEVLVTLTIVAIGLLGLVALQVRSQSWQRDAFERRTVAELAASLYDRITANYPGYVQNGYAVQLPVGAPLPAVPPCLVPQGCTPAEVAKRDAVAWLAELRRRVPSAAASMTRDDNLTLRLTVGWFEPFASAAGTPDPVCTAAGLIAAGYRCYVTEMRP